MKSRRILLREDIPTQIDEKTMADLSKLVRDFYNPLRHYHPRSVPKQAKSYCNDLPKLLVPGAYYDIRAPKSKIRNVRRAVLAWRKKWAPDVDYSVTVFDDDVVRVTRVKR